MPISNDHLLICNRFSAKDGATRSDKARPNTRLKVGRVQIAEIESLETDYKKFPRV